MDPKIRIMYSAYSERSDTVTLDQTDFAIWDNIKKLREVR
jgi:hypothetical protein